MEEEEKESYSVTKELVMEAWALFRPSTLTSEE
jgi:hypothetical protein